MIDININIPSALRMHPLHPLHHVHHQRKKKENTFLEILTNNVHSDWIILTSYEDFLTLVQLRITDPLTKQAIYLDVFGDENKTNR